MLKNGKPGVGAPAGGRTEILKNFLLKKSYNKAKDISILKSIAQSHESQIICALARAAIRQAESEVCL